jgi:hypothetical protein
MVEVIGWVPGHAEAFHHLSGQPRGRGLDYPRDHHVEDTFLELVGGRLGA